MNIHEWYFGFHDRGSLIDIARGRESVTTMFGHVEAWGYTIDGTWLFFDPRGRHTIIEITHLYEEILDFGQERFMRCREILKIGHRTDRITYPMIRPHLHCGTQCAALLGWRAYTLRGFRRMLLENGAEIVHERSEGRSSGEGGTGTATQASGS